MGGEGGEEEKKSLDSLDGPLGDAFLRLGFDEVALGGGHDD